MVLNVGGVISGQPREKGVQLQQAHVFTPESATTTHYFYAVSFPRAMGTQSFWDLKPLLLSIDGASVLARRILAKKIDAEQSDQPPA